jgi:hypothetical protein
MIVTLAVRLGFRSLCVESLKYFCLPMNLFHEVLKVGCIIDVIPFSSSIVLVIVM